MLTKYIRYICNTAEKRGCLVVKKHNSRIKFPKSCLKCTRTISKVEQYFNIDHFQWIRTPVAKRYISLRNFNKISYSIIISKNLLWEASRRRKLFFIVCKLVLKSYVALKKKIYIGKKKVLCSNAYQTLLPFYATQFNNHFLNSIISANHE